MLHNRNLRSATAALAFTAAMLVTSALASAQSPAPLPTAPGADRTVDSMSPATAAKASLPGDNGSPLEPYLFTFILVGGGIVGVIGVKLADRNIRADHTRFDTDGSRRVLGLPVI